jgi:predicted alpha/beta-fold hydrolase
MPMMLLCILLVTVCILDACHAFALPMLSSIATDVSWSESLDQQNQYNSSPSNDDHLVVLSHGIMGSHTDLSYLSNRLQRIGCTVLNSKSNEFTKSLQGIRQGGINLADEVLAMKKINPHLQRVSFVGNSLGGMYARYAIHHLFDNDTQSIAGLAPQAFMVIHPSIHFSIHVSIHLSISPTIHLSISPFIYPSISLHTQSMPC